MRWFSMPALTDDNLFISQLLHQRCVLGMTVAAQRSLMPACVCVCVATAGVGDV